MKKTAVVVLSDPKGGEQTLGRVFNALAAVYDFKKRNEDVQPVRVRRVFPTNQPEKLNASPANDQTAGS